MLAGFDRDGRKHRLGPVVCPASDAAAGASDADKELSIGLILPEQGRSMLATSLQEIRTDLQDLGDARG